MRILQVVNSLNTGGAEKLIAETVPLMVQRGYKVDVLLLCDTKTQLKKELTTQGIKVWGLTKSIKAIYNPLLIFKLIPILKKYDLIHVHLFPAQYWVALAKAIGGIDKLVVTTEHNTDNRRRHICVLKYLDKCIYRVYSQLFAISKGVLDNLASYIGMSNKMKLIKNGVNLEKIKNATGHNRGQFSLLDRDFVIIMVAGFRHQKDQSTIIRALTHLPNNVKLLLVGDGGRRKVCETLVKEAGLEERVHFMGVRQDVPELLKMCDVGVISSHWEGFGLVAVEYMSAGLPVVASNVEGLRDVVGEAGLLFERGNENELASHVIELMENKEYYKKVALQCFERAKQYDINGMVDQLIATYEEVIKNE